MPFSVEPAWLEFAFNEINQEADEEGGVGRRIVQTKALKLRNTGGEKCRFNVHLLEEQDGFRIQQQKAGAIFPGKFERVIVEFTPTVWGVSKALFHVKSSLPGDEMVPVTITGKALCRLIDSPLTRPA